VGIRPGQPYYVQLADILREEIRAGRFKPGDQLPSERELVEQHEVSVNTVRAALVQLRTEGLIVSQRGRRSVVADQLPVRRLSTDITEARGFYSMLDRIGKQPATRTTVERGPASVEVADQLQVEVGEEVVIRARVLGTEGDPPVGLATSYFPVWVVEAAPKLADPTVSGLPVWLREAFGDTYSEDLIDARMPTEDEVERLEIPEGVPVLIVKGMTFDAGQSRPLHFIDKVTPAGRMMYGYRFGAVPEE
jgi:GntR family transcriptional regulator